MNECMHPGGFELTKRAFGICALPETARVLDVGCGYGDTVARLKKEYGFSVTGIDISPEMIAGAKEKHPESEFVEGDGEALDFASRIFDCVLMECVLSLIPNPVEAVHEAYCVLKEGGSLIISDLYLPNPSAEDFEAISRVKDAKLNKKHDGSDCGENRVSDCTVNGALITDDIHAALNDLNFEIVLFEDRKRDLDNFAASLVFDGGIDDRFHVKAGQSKPSYFLLIGKKRGVNPRKV